MKTDAYLNNQFLLNWMRTPLEMEFTEQGYPIVKPLEDVPDEMKFIPFNYVVSGKFRRRWVQFYIQDYLFDRIWNAADKYVDILKKHPGVVGPDFSIYTDFPKPMQIWQHYKAQWCMAYWQAKGITVIPNVSWAAEDSYDFCFDGMPKNSVVSISATGCLQNKEAKQYFLKGYEKTQEVLEPKMIILHIAEKQAEDLIKISSCPVRIITYKFRHV